MTRMADSRDMVVAHLIYRRETRALADLVRGVAPGDWKRAAVVAELWTALEGQGRRAYADHATRGFGVPEPAHYR